MRPYLRALLALLHHRPSRPTPPAQVDEDRKLPARRRPCVISPSSRFRCPDAWRPLLVPATDGPLVRPFFLAFEARTLQRAEAVGGERP